MPADDAAAHPDILNQAAQGQLKSIIERVERLEQEKAEIAEQIKDVFTEAKGNGFDVKILRKVVRVRKQDRAKRLEEEAIFDLYMSAMDELPLFEPQRAPARNDTTMVSLTAGDGRVIIPPTPMNVLSAAVDKLKDDDAGYAEARDLVLKDRRASTSYIQRRLQIGYNRAAQYIERMQAEGLVAPADHTGKREVIAQSAEGVG